MNREELINKCEKAAHEMRIDAIKAAYSTGKTGAHIGGTLSMIEIMAVLYLAVLRMNPGNLRDESRDRFIHIKAKTFKFIPEACQGENLLGCSLNLQMVSVYDHHQIIQLIMRYGQQRLPNISLSAFAVPNQDVNPGRIPLLFQGQCDANAKGYPHPKTAA